MLWNRIAYAAIFISVAVAAGSCTRDVEATKRAHLEQGDKYFAEKRYAEAIVAYRNAVQQDERFGEARHHLARAYAMSNDPANALEQFVRAADLLPNDAVVQLDCAKALLLTRRFEDAKARADAVLKADPRNVDAHITQAMALAGLRDLDTAIASVESAIELQPGLSSSYVNLAALRSIQGNRPEAEAAFKQAIAADPKSIPAQLALANFYWATNRPADTETHLKKALEIDPASTDANRMLANFYVLTRRPTEAEAPLKKAAETAGDAQSKLGLADYYIGQGRGVDAKAKIGRAHV